MAEETEKNKTATILPPISKMKSQQQSRFNMSNDNEVFRMMTGQHKDDRQGKQVKIWQKTTANCRNALKRFNNFHTPIDDKYVSPNVYNPRDKKMIEDAIELINHRKKNKDLGSKKEVIGDILEQKKEMFLVTMTHGIIEEEIHSLKRQANDRKKALQESEQQLERDKQEFLAYQEKYKEDTRKVEEEFEAQVQKRKLKEQEIKVAYNITQSKQIIVNSLRTQQGRNQDNIVAYQKYKVSLDQLLPKEWIEQKEQRRKARIAELREQYYIKWLEQEYSENIEVSRDRLKLPPGKREQYDRRFNQAIIDDEIEELDELENEEKMYFKEPQELIQVLNGLQEDSLFCIQNARLASDAYQQLKSQFTQKKASLESKYKYLLETKSAMDKQLAEIEGQIRALRKKKQQNNSNINEKDNKDIKLVIENEYQAVKDVMPNLLQEIDNNTALSLLSRIETYMESLLQRLIEASVEHPKQIKEIRTNLQKRKNTEKREEVANFNKEEEEKRKLRNQSKKQPVERNLGRIDMARSAPRDKQKVQQVKAPDNQLDQDKKYLIQ